jgi:hypothetical protein
MRYQQVALFVALGLSALAAAQPHTTKIPNASDALVNPGALRAVRQADLVVESISPRLLGGRASINVCVRNVGIAASPATEVQVLSQAVAPPGQPPIRNTVTLGSSRLAPMAAGASACAELTTSERRLPTCVKYTVIADANAEVRESNESNNVREYLSECYGGPIPPR